ncbi:uncharacterized protein [Ptychodera flava]|uniref:uncharacterized protein n=1 Tax=Ptychodera flava TaxID=63121 RepID=UPI003969F006
MSVGDRKPINATVLFDDGSNRTFITQRFADKLNLKSDTHENVSLSTFGDNSKQIHSMKSAMVTLHEQNGHTSTVNALIIPEISSNLFNHVSAEILNSDHLRGLKLAHPVSNVKTMEIDVLIGADQYWNFVGNHIVRGAGPTAISSKFGYLLSGPTGKRGKLDSDINIHHVNVETHTDDDIRNWWNLELIGVKADSQNDENTDFETYRDTHLRVENGKYIARLPWKTDHPPLPSNYAATENRTRAMVRRLTPDLTKRYDDIITDQLRRDFVEKIQDDNKTEGHYLPHRAVKKDSVTTPIRIVYDCSSKQNADSASLNDCLQTGPSLINDLPAILLRFRANRVAFVSDIEKAFLNIRLEEDERQYTKFLWLSDIRDPESPFDVYQFKSVLFGAACSPFMLNAVIKTHLESNASIPTADDLKHNIYVDNVIDGAKSDEKAVSYYNDANHLMQSCGFKLRSWTSNSERLCELAKQDDIYEPSRDVPVLGLRWEPESDTMTYSENNSEPIPNELITKRDVLSSSATLYDPLGFVAPVHIKAKLFVQSLWKRGLPWDEPLDAELNSQWIQIAADLNATRKTTINRQYFSGNKDNDDCEVHVFADASTTAYGAVVYLRSSSETSIVMAKARVAQRPICHCLG